MRTRPARSAAQYAGWIAAAAGAVLCALGWYGVSGERFAERQIPFLASSTIPGAALIVAGAVLLGFRGGAADTVTATRIEELHRLLVTADADPAEAGTGARTAVTETGARTDEKAGGTADTRKPVDGTVRLAVPGGSVHHRPDCPLVEGKAEASEVSPSQISQRELAPCPVCEGRDHGACAAPRNGSGGTSGTGAGGGERDAS